jgi:diguanylate cyclase (GGDEF)-like protein
MGDLTEHNSSQGELCALSSDKNSDKPVVLLIDDSPSAQLRIKQLLDESNHGYDVKSITTAAEASRQLKERFDVCLLDYELRECTGLDVLAGIDPSDLSGPVILVTSHDEYGISQAAMQMGVSDFIAKKHLDAAYLDRAIRFSLNRYKKEKALVQTAKFDSLTGLTSRKQFEYLLEDMVEEASLSQQSLSLLYIDLDGLKEINNCYSHAVGNQTLKSSANVINSQLSSEQQLCRYGGDEFLVALPNCDMNKAMETAEDIASALRKRGGEDPYVTTASIGVVTFPDEADDHYQLIHLAEMATEVGKSKQKDTVRAYTSSDGHGRIDELRLARELRIAIGRKELSLAYQPIWDQAGQQVLGVEALARWQHPEHGNLSPELFVAVAETHGLIREFGQWVLKTALEDYRDWGERGLLVDGFTLSVNVSALQFLDNRFVSSISKLLGSVKHICGHLELELTENAFVRDFDRLASMVRQLNKQGVSTALDDFGQRYSSLGYLPDFQFDTLKVDRSFVAKLGQNQRSESIVETMVDLAKKLGASIVAEGVETEQQHKILRQLGCQRMQGFLFSKPLAAKDLVALMT